MDDESEEVMDFLSGQIEKATNALAMPDVNHHWWEGYRRATENIMEFFEAWADY